MREVHLESVVAVARTLGWLRDVAVAHPFIFSPNRFGCEGMIGLGFKVNW